MGIMLANFFHVNLRFYSVACVCRSKCSLGSLVTLQAHWLLFIINNSLAKLQKPVQVKSQIFIFAAWVQLKSTALKKRLYAKCTKNIEIDFIFLPSGWVLDPQSTLWGH